jgi:hypothetical protein
MTLKTQARIKVGFASVDKTFNDLIMDCAIKDFKVFKNEIGKYLKVLKELPA